MCSCFVGLILIAGVSINPCHISSMHDSDYYGEKQCVIKFNSGDAWSGQHGALVKANCAYVNERIRQAMTTPDNKTGEGE